MRLFIDMDGTLAVFHYVSTETLYEQGYFVNLNPHEEVVQAVKRIMMDHSDIEIYILSAYLTDSAYALSEKNAWLDRYLPEIDDEHRVFVPCGRNKKEFIDGGCRVSDFLLDDFTENLFNWQKDAGAIKLLNAINHTKGRWNGSCVSYDMPSDQMAEMIVSIMRESNSVA